MADTFRLTVTAILRETVDILECLLLNWRGVQLNAPLCQNSPWGWQLLLAETCRRSDSTRGGADKFLARPRMKQSAVTKLGIYSTYSPRSSIHVLARCSNFCKPLKKIQNVVRPTRSPRQQWPPRRTKNGDLSIVFSVQGTGGSPTGPDLENRVGDQDIGSPGRQVSSCCKCPVSRGIVAHVHQQTKNQSDMNIFLRVSIEEYVRYCKKEHFCLRNGISVFGVQFL